MCTVFHFVPVNGSVDPWHSLSITRTKNPLIQAVYIEGSPLPTFDSVLSEGTRPLSFQSKESNIQFPFPFFTYLSLLSHSSGSTGMPVFHFYESCCIPLPNLTQAGTAHCADMLKARPTDPPMLAEAQTQIGEIIHGWIERS